LLPPPLSIPGRDGRTLAANHEDGAVSHSRGPAPVALVGTSLLRADQAGIGRLSIRLWRSRSATDGDGASQ
jgi:hypothetical protein